jgi:hypothetical protein
MLRGERPRGRKTVVVSSDLVRGRDNHNLSESQVLFISRPANVDINHGGADLWGPTDPAGKTIDGSNLRRPALQASRRTV